MPIKTDQKVFLYLGSSSYCFGNRFPAAAISNILEIPSKSMQATLSITTKPLNIHIDCHTSVQITAFIPPKRLHESSAMIHCLWLIGYESYDYEWLTNRRIKDANKSNNQNSKIDIKTSNLVHCKSWRENNKTIVKNTLKQWCHLKWVIRIRHNTHISSIWYRLYHLAIWYSQYESHSMSHTCHANTNHASKSQFQIFKNWCHSQIVIDWNEDECSNNTGDGICHIRPRKCTSIYVILAWRS